MDRRGWVRSAKENIVSPEERYRNPGDGAADATALTLFTSPAWLLDERPLYGSREATRGNDLCVVVGENRVSSQREVDVSTVEGGLAGGQGSTSVDYLSSHTCTRRSQGGLDPLVAAVLVGRVDPARLQACNNILVGVLDTTRASAGSSVEHRVTGDKLVVSLVDVAAAADAIRSLVVGSPSESIARDCAGAVLRERRAIGGVTGGEGRIACSHHGSGSESNSEKASDGAEHLY